MTGTKLIFPALLLMATSVRAQKEFDGLRGTHNWIGFSDAPNALYHHIAGRAYEQLDKRSQQIQGIHTLEGWRQRQAYIKKVLQEAVGTYPEKTPLHAVVTQTIQRDGYRIENIVYESQPGYFVTSSLFIPDGAGNNPAIIYCSGHADAGYRSKIYLKTILNLVKKGFVVFAFDPIGQGERLQYYEASTGRSAFKWPAFEHSYVGAQVFITGNTLARDFIWDGIRAVDYLITRKEVDPKRIGITGRSGGGTQSAYIAAFDDRIAAAAPENYITSFKWLFRSMGPQDAEQNFFHGIKKGLEMADLLAACAPRPMLIVTTTQDMFPIQGALETVEEVTAIYKAYGKSGNFSMVSDDAPHASTQKNREAVYRFFQEALNNPGNPREEQVDIPQPELLQVTKTGQVTTSLNSATVFSRNCKEARKRMQKLQATRRNMPGYFSNMLASAKQLSGFVQPAETSTPVFTGRIQRTGYVIEKYLLKGEGNYQIPYTVCKPAMPTQKAVLYIHPQGKAAEAGPGGTMESLVKNGVMVVAPDLVGIGEMGPGAFKGDSYIDSVSYNVWFAAMLVGRSITGIQAGDLLRVVNQLTKEGVQEIYGLAIQQMSPVLLHAAAFDKRISRVALIAPYASYLSMVMNEHYNPHFLHSTVSGSIGVYDLPDLAASLAPRKLMICGMADGSGSSADTQSIAESISVIALGYKQRGAAQQLQIVTGPMDFNNWLTN
jgi:Acetyl esterase (deacetylase)